MKIVVDRNIPFVQKPLEALGAQVVALPGDAITPAAMDGADVLLTRTRTSCDSQLLGSSPCRFIGTATIGTDHIDLDWCRSRGITVANAPGCNAPAVAQWVLAALRAHLGAAARLDGVTLGVIGHGNVGSIVARWAMGLGMRVIVNDPPQQAASPAAGVQYATLADIARECDAVTVHTPLVSGGKWPTRHLLDSGFIGSLRRSPLVLNAARGPVACTQALLDGLDSGRISALAIDCWEGEPHIDLRLLGRALVATPHIAGYSLEGKIRASQMVLEALGRHLGLDTPLRADAPAPPPVPATVTEAQVAYDIIADTRRLKEAPGLFEALRNGYPLRHEQAVQ